MEQTELNNDLLEGAKSIANYLGWPVRRVYYMHESPKCKVPIWYEPGIGIMSSKTALNEWKNQRVKQAIAPIITTE